LLVSGLAIKGDFSGVLVLYGLKGNFAAAFLFCRPTSLNMRFGSGIAIYYLFVLLGPIYGIPVCNFLSLNGIGTILLDNVKLLAGKIAVGLLVRGANVAPVLLPVFAIVLYGANLAPTVLLCLAKSFDAILGLAISIFNSTARGL